MLMEGCASSMRTYSDAEASVAEAARCSTVLPSQSLAFMSSCVEDDGDRRDQDFPPLEDV